MNKEIIKQLREQCENDEYLDKICIVIEALLLRDDSDVLASFVRKMCRDNTAPDIDVVSLISYKHGRKNLVRNAERYNTSKVSMSRWLNKKSSITSKQLDYILNH